jgi:iron complex outermembrane receptor protein
VGTASAEGAEIEFTWLPTDNLTFNVNVGILSTSYDEIAAGTFALDTTTEFAQAPDLTYNIGAQYEIPMDSGASVTTRIDYSYTDQFWRSLPFLRMDWYGSKNGGPVPDSADESGDWGTINARVTYEARDGNYSVALFGTNLTDEYMLNSGFFHGIWGYNFATVSRPREFGASLTVNF